MHTIMGGDLAPILGPSPTSNMGEGTDPPSPPLSLRPCIRSLARRSFPCK